MLKCLLVEECYNSSYQHDGAGHNISSILNISGTNINSALEQSVHFFNTESPVDRSKVLLFLTDGQPTSGETRVSFILSNLRRLNEMEIPVISLAFGRNANFDLAKKMSAQNYGFARRIYVDSDAALQIQGLYKEISSVVLQDVEFQYLNGSVDTPTLTTPIFKQFYEGSERVVCGKLGKRHMNALDNVRVSATSADGKVELFLEKENIVDFTYLNITQDADIHNIARKLWAYLTIKDLLKQMDIVDNQTREAEIKQQIIDMSLKVNRH